MKLDIECMKNNIRKLAKMNNTTMKQLEYTIGVSEGYFSRRTESTPVDLHALFKASDILGVSLNTLFDESLSDILDKDLPKISILDKLIEHPERWSFSNYKLPDELRLEATVDGEFDSEMYDAIVKYNAMSYPMYRLDENNNVLLKSFYHPWVDVYADGKPVEFNAEGNSLLLHRLNVDGNIEFELYFMKDFINVEPIAHTCSRKYINDRLEQLYNAIVEAINETDIDENITFRITEMINNPS